MLAKAISIAARAFEHKKDKGGNPYILHCLYVMHKVKHLGETAMICAVLHDLIEDCEKQGFGREFIVNQGFSTEVSLILELLTHRPETPYMDYVKALTIHPLAREIKMADLEHNTKVTRLKNLTKKNLDRLEMYFHAYEYLKQI